MSLPRLTLLAATGAALVIANFALAEINKTAAQPTRTATASNASIETKTAISELRFQDIFKLPIGERGPEPTAKLLALNHQRVRITGYQVKEGEPRAGVFILAPNPVEMSEMEDGAADDLPAATIFAHMPATDASKIIAYRSGPRELTGVLDIGNQEEANGRTSFVRLHIDPS